MSTRRTLAIVLAAAALAFAACGSEDDDASPSSSSGDSATTSTTSAAPASSDETLQAATTSLGDVLVDADGRTLYVFTKDAGGKSNCTGQCAQTWPPLTATGAPTAGEGADATKLGTITRDDGSAQVTYAGSPLYLYAPDTSPGDTKGQGVGGVWFVVSPDGKPVT